MDGGTHARAMRQAGDLSRIAAMLREIKAIMPGQLVVTSAEVAMGFVELDLSNMSAAINEARRCMDAALGTGACANSDQMIIELT